MFEKIIEDSINNIHKTYVNNELAFLAIQGKIELQLRDKIAWYIEQNINAGPYDINAGPYYVSREYNAPSNGREKCDLAILDNKMNPVCLIEFKAHSAATFESKYKTKCDDDIDKMQRIASSTGTTPEIYYIFFQTEHKEILPLPVNNGLIAYYDIIERALNKKLGITNIHNKWDTKYKNGKNYSNGTITKL